MPPANSEVSDAASRRWVFKAIIYKLPGHVASSDDVDPSPVSSLVHDAEMKVAETRAVNRGLRKTYGIGLCWVEATLSLHTCLWL